MNKKELITKDYNKYINDGELMIVITPLDIEGNFSFHLKKDCLIIKNKKNNYILNSLGEDAREIIIKGNAFMVEVGNGKKIAEYDIECI